MNIAVFGLGYVGCVTTACFARDGHHVTGVDVNPDKVKMIQSGKSPIIEPGLGDLLLSGVETDKIKATTTAAKAVNESEILIICVGTPSRPNGSLDLKYVKIVCGQIGEILKTKSAYTTVVIRSTMLPGSAPDQLIPILEEHSGKKVGDDFGFCVNPEFLREGTAIHDFDNPPYTVIGEFNEKSGNILAELYSSIDAPLYRVPLGSAEMVKYASNAFHALKVAFANEIGNLCKHYGVDGHEVMNIFVEDNKLNLSPYYLKPGFAFGGSCLPKDVRALEYASRAADIELPVMEAILPSNKLQIEKAFDMLVKQGNHKVGFMGLSFKANTDDLRESPTVELAERLIGKGFEVAIYDHEVSLSKLHGSNLAYIDTVIPHISSLMKPSLEEVVNSAESIVIAKKPSQTEYQQLNKLITADHVIIDLVRVNGDLDIKAEENYDGICW